LELGGVPCCRVNAEAGVNVGGVLDGKLVKLKLTPAATPEAAAETVYGPPTVAFAVTVPVVAVPLLIVAGLPAIEALAPLPGGVKVTFPPFTGSAKALDIVTASGFANAVFTTVLWLLPPEIAIVKPRDSKAPMSVVVCCGRAIPRWSVA